MTNGNWLIERLHRVPVFLTGLLVQIIVTASLTPWQAASDSGFFAGTKRALIAGLMANVIVCLILLRRPRGPPGQGVTKGFSEGSNWKPVLYAFGGLMLLSFVGAISVDTGSLGPFAATALIVVLQQLVLVAVAFQVQKRAIEGDLATSFIPKLVVICALASLFAVVIPSLFRQIATKTIVANNVTDLAFAMPVMLVAMAGLARVILARLR